MLLTHKASIGEQISLSISANPGETKWYDMETDKEGRNTRVIKNAELLQADIVAQPANVDARAIDIVLKHLKETGCGDDCIVCQFDKCIEKQVNLSSLVIEKESNAKMTQLSKEDQLKLNKEHGCKEGETFCPKEGKCLPDEPTKSKLSPTVEKFIEALKALATAKAPLEDNDVEQDLYGDNNAAGLESIVQQALASMRAVPAQGQFNPAIPVAQIAVKPGISGQSGVQPQTTNIPSTPDLDTLPINPGQVPVSPGTSGQSGVQPQNTSTPSTPDLDTLPIPPAQVQASAKKEPTIKKEHIRTVLFDKSEYLSRLEKARENVIPKQENAGEILPNLIITTKLEGEVKKTAEAYNAEVRKIHASQVKQQYTPNDLVKMAEEGKLVKELDEDGALNKVVKIMAKKKDAQKIGSLLLTKAV